MNHIITMDKNKVDRVCEPPNGRSRYRRLKGTELLLRLSDMRIVSQDYDFLTDKEAEIAQNALLTAINDRESVDTGSDKQWAVTAVKRELEAIERTGDENPHRPDSEFWACLIRIASVLKGSGRKHIDPNRVRVAIHRYAPMSLRTKGNREKDLDYLFGRAMNQAHPRYRIKGVR